MSRGAALLFWSTLLLFSQLAKANTEIINFEYPQHLAPLPFGIDAKPQRLIILNEPSELSLPVTHSSQNRPQHTLLELTYQFDGESPRRQLLEDWQKKYLRIKAKRTVRLSWPASHPMNFKLELFAIPDSARRATPQFGGYLLVTYRSTSVHSPSAPVGKVFETVPVTILVEPCWLGGIPESLLGAIGSVLLLVAGLIVGGVPQKFSKGLRRLGGTDEKKRE